MMTQEKLLSIAMRQSAIESNCHPEDFLSSQNKVVLSARHTEARAYLELPFFCDFTSYGNNLVASVSPEFFDAAQAYIDKYPVEHCFETPNLHVLEEQLHPFGMRICFMAEYFLPDLHRLHESPCAFEIRVMEPEELGAYYRPEWENALCMARRERDVLGVGAFCDGTLIGLAGASADCGTMWQIGIDVLPGFRRQGIASAITSRLALRILERGKVPFYCCAWSNLRSARNAVKSGFSPAWVQMTAKPRAFVEEMNR